MKNNIDNLISYIPPIREESKFWFNNYGFLYNFDEKTMKTERKYLFHSIREIPFYSIGCVDGCLVMLPHEENNIALYNIKKNSATYICLNTEEKSLVYASALTYKNKVFMFPAKIEQGILILESLENVRTINIDKWQLKLDDLTDSCKYVVCGNDVWIIHHNKNTFLKLDMEKEQYEIIPIDKAATGFTGIAIDEECLWLAESTTGDLICFNIYTEKIKRYNAPLELDYNCCVRNNVHQDIFNFKDNIITIPGIANKMTIFNKQTEEFIVLNIDFLDSFDVRYKTGVDYTCSFGKKIDENTLWVQRTKDGLIASINVEDFSYKTFSFKADLNEIGERLIECSIHNREMMYENKSHSLEMYVKVLGKINELL